MPETNFSRDVTTTRGYDSRDVMGLGAGGGGEYDPYRTTYASRSSSGNFHLLLR